ncbi:hypothetical protein [Corynebacterium kroppenstedtii]|nr:hypothetical protein [Corynebacterium kroppenstedtii]
MPFSYGGVLRYHDASGVIKSRRQVSGMVDTGPTAALTNPKMG